MNQPINQPIKKSHIQKFNSWLAVKITNGTATMYCAYGFALLAIFGFPYKNLTSQSFVQWMSQTFIQLTMLSILSVGQRLQSQQAATHHAEHMAHIRKIHKKLGGGNR